MKLFVDLIKEDGYNPVTYNRCELMDSTGEYIYTFLSEKDGKLFLFIWKTIKSNIQPFGFSILFIDLSHIGSLGEIGVRKIQTLITNYIDEPSYFHKKWLSLNGERRDLQEILDEYKSKVIYNLI
jgi:hypothetical protein